MLPARQVHQIWLRDTHHDAHEAAHNHQGSLGVEGAHPTCFSLTRVSHDNVVRSRDHSSLDVGPDEGNRHSNLSLYSPAARRHLCAPAQSLGILLGGYDKSEKMF